jgi:hypothetical protein
MKCPICEELELQPDEMACINCRMTGRDLEFYLLHEARSCVLTRIRALTNVETAKLWPMSMNAFMLMVITSDERLVACCAETPLGPLPAIPPLGMPWVIAVGSLSEALGGQSVQEGGLDDDGLVGVIQALR